MITTEQAHILIAAAEGHADKLGVPVNIAVLDAAAHLKAFSRQDGAVLGSIDIAMSKARTSALFRIPSADVWEYCKPGAPAPGLENSNGGLAVFPGGVPIVDRSGTIIGAVGVSGGAPSQDLEIAQRAVAAIVT